jgi:hypothetical protein
MIRPHNDLNRADATTYRRRAEQLAIAAHARGVPTTHTFPLTKSAYNRIDNDPAHGEQILNVLGKSLDALTPSINFAKAAGGVTQPVAPADADRFWSVTTDGSVTRYTFDLAGYLAAVGRGF